MTNNEFTNFFKILLFFAMMVSFYAYQEIKVYRLIQYEAEEKVYGSQYTSLNYIGTHYKGDLLRKIALLKITDITSMEELAKYFKSNANAFLIILPKSDDITEPIRQLLLEIQKFLSEQTLYIPIYFTTDSKEVNSIYNELEEISRDEHPENYSNDKENSYGIYGYFKLENNLLQFTLNASDSKKNDALNFENIYGYLEGNSAGGITNPLIAIVTNYDDLSAIPDYPSGINTNASGVIAMMEIIRILSKYYENYESFVHYDLLFLLTSGGALNYQGSQNYINSLDSTIIENIHFVLCLDSLALDETELFFHLSRYPKPDDEVAYKIHKVYIYIYIYTSNDFYFSFIFAYLFINIYLKFRL